MEGRSPNRGKYFLLLILIVFFCSCTDNSSNNAFKILNEGIERSSIAIERSTQVLLVSMKTKLNDPTTSYKAEIWYPKAELVGKLSSDLTNNIEKLKAVVKKEKTLPDKNAIELYSQLLDYKKDLLNIDSSLKMEFENKTIITAGSFDSTKHNANDFLNTFFKRLSTEATISILNKFQNNIKIIENRMTQFCNYKIPDSEAFYETYSVMVVQNSTYIKKGDQIEVTAGVGAFSLKAKPTMTINGKNIFPGPDGAAYYKLKVSKALGKQYIPVEINFTDPEGKKEKVSKTIEYTIIE